MTGPVFSPKATLPPAKVTTLKLYEYVPAAGLSITERAYGEFSLPAEPSN
jgi:hypothetical protein